MKGIPKTPVEFDYDLWTTEDGKCMVRIKATGEVTEVERTVMQVLLLVWLCLEISPTLQED